MKYKNYRKLFATLLLSCFIMYGIMFINVDKAGQVYLSLARLYMALAMVAPMAIIMLLMMPKMYTDKNLNSIIGMSGLLIFSLSLIMLRSQAFIGDVQYLKGMIPHHSSAILSSKNAAIEDPEIRALAQSIIESQEREIRQMQEMLERVNK